MQCADAAKKADENPKIGMSTVRSRRVSCCRTLGHTWLQSRSGHHT